MIMSLRMYEMRIVTAIWKVTIGSDRTRDDLCF
jgi:hypothetical protein